MNEPITIVIELSSMNDETVVGISELLYDIAQCFESAHRVQLRRYHNKNAQQTCAPYQEYEMSKAEEQLDFSDEIPF